jgi:hypothetical protein
MTTARTEQRHERPPHDRQKREIKLMAQIMWMPPA